MYCTKCGALNDDRALKCVKCGSMLEQFSQSLQQTSIKIPNHLVFAIIVTILCCVPLGIPAIVFAAQVNGKIAAGDIEGAKEKSRKALMWCWIAFGTGLIFGIAYLMLIMLGVFAEAF